MANRPEDAHGLIEEDVPLGEQLERIRDEDDPRFGLIMILRNRLNGKKFFMKQKDAFDLNDHNRDAYQANERAKLNHPHILRMLDFTCEQTVVEGENLYIVRGFYEHPANDMSQEIKRRKLQREFFSGLELVTLFSDILNAIVFLQKQKMVHGDVRPSYIAYSEVDNCFMLMDRLGDPSPPHQAQHNNYHSSKDLYLSPALFNALSQGSTRFRHNPYKSDLFSLGLVVLETGLLRSIKPLFSGSTFNKSHLDECLREFQSLYKDAGLTEALKKSLVINEAQRMDPADLLGWIKRSKVFGANAGLHERPHLSGMSRHGDIRSFPETEKEAKFSSNISDKASNQGSVQGGSIQQSRTVYKFDKFNTAEGQKQSLVPDSSLETTKKHEPNFQKENYLKNNFTSNDQSQPEDDRLKTKERCFGQSRDDYDRDTNKVMTVSPVKQENQQINDQNNLLSTNDIRKSGNEMQERELSTEKRSIISERVIYQGQPVRDISPTIYRTSGAVEHLTRSTSPPKFERPSAAIQTDQQSRPTINMEARGTSPPPSTYELNKQPARIITDNRSTSPPPSTYDLNKQPVRIITDNRSTSPLRVIQNTAGIQTISPCISVTNLSHRDNTPLKNTSFIEQPQSKPLSIISSSIASPVPFTQGNNQTLIPVDGRPGIVKSVVNSPQQLVNDQLLVHDAANMHNNTNIVDPSKILFKAPGNEVEYGSVTGSVTGRGQRNSGGIVRDGTVSAHRQVGGQSASQTPTRYASEVVRVQTISTSPRPALAVTQVQDPHVTYRTTITHQPMQRHPQTTTIIRSSNYIHNPQAPVSYTRTDVYSHKLPTVTQNGGITTTTIVGQPTIRSTMPQGQVFYGPAATTVVSGQATVTQMPPRETYSRVTFAQPVSPVQVERSHRPSMPVERKERSSSISVGKFGMSVYNPETGKTLTSKTTVYRDHSNEPRMSVTSALLSHPHNHFDPEGSESLKRAADFNRTATYRPILPPTSIFTTIEDGDTTKAHAKKLLEECGQYQTEIYSGPGDSETLKNPIRNPPISRTLRLAAGSRIN